MNEKESAFIDKGAAQRSETKMQTKKPKPNKTQGIKFRVVKNI